MWIVKEAAMQAAPPTIHCLPFDSPSWACSPRANGGGHLLKNIRDSCSRSDLELHASETPLDRQIAFARDPNARGTDHLSMTSNNTESQSRNGDLPVVK